MIRYAIILYLLLSIACRRDVIETADREQLFISAVIDASKELSESDIYDRLVSLEYGASPLAEWKVIGQDTLILVATLQSKEWIYSDVKPSEEFTTSTSLDEMIWVTIPGEICSKLSAERIYSDSLSLNNRMIELLGLRHDGNESTVSLMWIDKNSLLRPSYDPNTKSTHGAIEYPTDEKALPTWYQEWFEGNISYSYESPSKGLNYPFTRLGYTYDWSEEGDKYGLSEFVTAPESKITIKERMGCWNFYQHHILK